MTHSTESIVVVGAARTPLGGLLGALAPLRAPELGAAALRAALERGGVPAADVDEVIMGCVLPAGQGQAPARQAAIGAGIPQGTPCTTINKMCGSGMRSVMFGMDLIRTGSARIVAAGGMESMSNAPYLLPGARAGMRLGHGQVVDHMFLDGLEDAYDRGRLMGTFAEDTAKKYGFTREAQDSFAIASLTRAQEAIRNGKFGAEIVPVTVRGRKGEEIRVDTDEQPGNASVDKIPRLKPAFAKDGTVTAANSSSISDGAAALVITTADEAWARSWTPRARLLAYASHAQEPAWFTTAPVGAIRKVLDKVGWKTDDVDLYEINEAFAVVTMAAMHDLGLPHGKVNVHGGACALGHPIGASGARILVTLINALHDRGLKRGVAAICIGGGEATAIALEIV
jgi:acetyl-CoA C-acetyltransferase